MAFFDKIQQVAKSAEQVAKNAASGAGDMIETQKLNMKINEEQKKIIAAKTQIGDLVWKRESSGALVDDDVAEQLAQIRLSLDMIGALEQQIADIKLAESGPAPAPVQPAVYTAPAAEAPAAAADGATAFCTNCGAKIAAEAKFCPSCGTPR